MTSLKY